MADDLVWVGCCGGQAVNERPLPVSVTDGACIFRTVMLGALEQDQRDWRLIGPVGNNDAQLATLEADLAVTSLLRSTVPSHVSILPDNIGLPRMQPFHVNLYQRTSQTNDIANELANHIREQFQRRFQEQASPMARKAS